MWKALEEQVDLKKMDGLPLRRVSEEMVYNRGVWKEKTCWADPS